MESGMVLANATDIKIWANRRDAQDQIPRLLRRLIHATCTQVDRIGFPSDESVQSGGYDGVVVIGIENAFLPDACSVWEFGATINVKGKADSDYEKRSNDPLNIDRSNTTFIFVTPRIWGNKNEWAAAKCAEKVWRRCS